MAEAVASGNFIMKQVLPKVQLGLLYVVAFGIGLIPFAVLIKSPLAWLGMLALIAVAFVVASWSHDQYLGESPSHLEVAFCALGRCAAGATVGLFGIGIYYGVSGIRSLFDFGGSGVDSYGFYASVVIVLLFIMALASVDIPEVITGLYPGRPGQRSPFFPRASESSALWRVALSFLGVAGVLAAILAASYFDSLAEYLTITILIGDIALLLIGSGCIDAKTIDAAHGTPESAISAVKALLEAAGYRVIPRPRTGDAGADLVISILDFLALRPKYSIAGRIRAQQSRPGGDVHYEAAMLEFAVWVLEDQLRKQGQTKIKLTPTLLVLGSIAEKSSDGESSVKSTGTSVQIVQGPSEAELAEMLAAADKGRLNAVAEGLFGSSSSGRTS